MKRYNVRLLTCIKTVVRMELASKNVHLGGYCNHEYLSVKKTLLKMLQDKTEENVQLCVFVDGECVVDLCGTSTGDFGHDRDKLQVIFLVKSNLSTSKKSKTVVFSRIFSRTIFGFRPFSVPDPQSKP